MMAVLRKYRVEKMDYSVDGYSYMVKLVTSLDGGKSFYYCGDGKYFKTEQEALQWKAEQERG